MKLFLIKWYWVRLVIILWFINFGVRMPKLIIRNKFLIDACLIRKSNLNAWARSERFLWFLAYLVRNGLAWCYRLMKKLPLIKHRLFVLIVSNHKIILEIFVTQRAQRGILPLYFYHWLRKTFSWNVKF